MSSGLITALENELGDWFDGSEPRRMYYDETWHSLIALPASYGSAERLNDHHFHLNKSKNNPNETDTQG